jgi:hypothetical protein
VNPIQDARAGGVRQKPEMGFPEADTRDRRQRVNSGPWPILLGYCR